MEYSIYTWLNSFDPTMWFLIIYSMLFQKFSVLGKWEGYRSTGTDTNKEKPGFRVRKLLGIRMILGFLRGHSFYKVEIRLNKNSPCEYIMENQISKPSCRIVDTFGGLVAEVN